MTTRTKAAVVGAGHFGRFHARHYADHPDVDLVAVVDCDFGKAEALAGAYGAAAFASCEGLSEIADIATVAVPTSAHFVVAGALIELGLSVLVEKPVTETVAQAEALCRAARARGGFAARRRNKPPGLAATPATAAAQRGPGKYFPALDVNVAYSRERRQNLRIIGLTLTPCTRIDSATTTSVR
jgi:hypothetical protein